MRLCNAGVVPINPENKKGLLILRGKNKQPDVVFCDGKRLMFHVL